MLLSVSSGLNSVVQFVTVLFIFIFVLAITYVTTRWIANYQKGMNAGKNMEIIETCKIAPNKYLQIVKAGEKYLVIGIGKDTVTMLAELTEEQIEFSQMSPQSSMNFKEILEKAKNLKQKK